MYLADLLALDFNRFKTSICNHVSLKRTPLPCLLSCEAFLLCSRRRADGHFRGALARNFLRKLSIFNANKIFSYSRFRPGDENDRFYCNYPSELKYILHGVGGWGPAKDIPSINHRKITEKGTGDTNIFPLVILSDFLFFNEKDRIYRMVTY